MKKEPLENNKKDEVELMNAISKIESKNVELKKKIIILTNRIKALEKQTTIYYTYCLCRKFLTMIYNNIKTIEDPIKQKAHENLMIKMILIRKKLNGLIHFNGILANRKYSILCDLVNSCKTGYCLNKSDISIIGTYNPNEITTYMNGEEPDLKDVKKEYSQYFHK